jgi:argininosuccinate lyase
MARFDERPAQPLIDSAYWLETQDAPLLHHDLTLADVAHIIHVAEQNVMPREIARTLLAALLELNQDANFVYDPQHGDAFTNREHWLRAHAPAVAGYLATGRARREATTVAFRLRVRRDLLVLMRALGDAQQAMLDLAARHVTTVMPDYTYLQQAHPTTFAHYLLTFVYPLRRDFVRLRDTFVLINQSPAGIGSTNGSRLPLARERMAALLGFAGVIKHTRDAMWQVDAPLQVVSAAATLMLHLDKLAEDLQIFNTTEFGFIELADAYARASIIMPQKKNPYALTFVRGAAASLLGRLTESFAIAQTPSAQIDNRMGAHGLVPRALDLTTRSVALMAGVCSTLIVKPEPMARWLEAGFTQATDLAETLVQECNIDHRMAHRIVGSLVRELLEQQKTARDITPTLIDEMAQVTIGHPLNLSAKKLAEALDPIAIVNTRTGIGGAAPSRVNEMVAECRADVEMQRAWLAETAKRMENVEAELIEHARQLTHESSA